MLNLTVIRRKYVPPIVGSVVFILIGWFMMDSGTKEERKTNL
jgi:hypothetical protein